MRNKFIFLIRAYNDLDHNAPLAYFLLGLGGQVTLLNVDSNIADDDYRLDILRRHEKFEYAKVANWNFTKDKPAGTVLSVVERVLYKLFLSSSTSAIWNILVKIWITKNRWILDAVTNANCVFFEWGRPEQRGVAVFAIHRLAKANEVPTVALPHGCNIFARGGSNTAVRRKLTYCGGGLRDKPFWDYNYFCVQNPIRKIQLESNYGAPRNIVAIGSLRFSDGWRAQMRHSLPDQSEVHQKGFKITLMEFQKGYGAAKNELSAMIRCIESLSDVSFVLKRSTREGKSLGVSSRSVVVGNECHSMPLIGESDCVIVYGSSIAIEVVLQRKVLITPSYLGLGQSFFERHRIGLIPKSPEQLQAMLEDISADHTAHEQAIDEQNRKLAMVVEEYVNGGNSGGPEQALLSVLDRCGVRIQEHDGSEECA